MKRILCFIDSLGAGGAQRQLVNLAIGLKKRDYIVSFLVYHVDDFYLPILQENGIEISNLEIDCHLKRVIRCCKFIRKGKFDVVISFLETPSFISEIAGLPFHRWKIIVGERSAAPRIVKTIRGRCYRLFHLLADVVVANSNCNRLLVKKANPFLSINKNKTIYNLYDLDSLSPDQFIRNKVEDGKFHILVAASHQRLKNLSGLAKAISLLAKQERSRLVIDWYGRQDKKCFEESLSLIKQLGVEDNFKFYVATLEIYQKMIDADAVGIFSIYEGLSNTICEAMCLCKIVITTDISDNRLILQNDKLISDAHSPKSIAVSLSYLLSLSIDKLNTIGRENRKRAIQLFSERFVVDQYMALFD